MKWYLVYVGLALGLLVFIVWYRSRPEPEYFHDAPMDIPSEGVDPIEDPLVGGPDAFPR